MQVSPDHIITLTLIFILGGSFLVFYVNLYNHRKRKHLEEKKLLQQQFDEELVKTQMEVQEQILKTIAAEIHDNVGQLLSLSKLTLGTIDVVKDANKAQLKVQSALNLLDASIKELRQLTSVLYADNLLAAGLDSAIKNELNWLSRSEKYHIVWHCNDEAAQQIHKEPALIAFRLIQELINNIVKHAEASTIAVQLEYHAQEVAITITDNGKGFDVLKVIENPTGLGITNVFKRAKMINGELTLTSEATRGTTAVLKFPY